MANKATAKRTKSSQRSDVILVDDDDNLRRLVSLRLQSADIHCRDFPDAASALRAVQEHRPAAVLTDLRMDGMDGMALLEQLRADHPSLPVVMMTAHGDIPDAVRATQLGAVNFLTKPLDHSLLLDILQPLLASSAEESETPDMPGVVTQSAAMMSVLDDALRIAKTNSSVLIRGPSGTGKEVLARGIHAASQRSKQAFVAINCGAIPADLLESELFGHKKGAFTGASRDHTGLFERANGGTILLDEIGDMPAELQVKLLRVLQEREIRRVGDSQSVPVDVRVISATHRDLDAAIADGAFREDLLYRLNVVSLELPPLESRREDIPLLADHFLNQLTQADQQLAFAPEAMELLAGAHWPGNIRQLRNVVERCVALAPAPVIDAALVQRALGKDEKRLVPLAEARDAFVRDYLIRLLKLSGGNVSQAARLAERNRTEFYKLLSRHDIDPGGFKPDPS